MACGLSPNSSACLMFVTGLLKPDNLADILWNMEEIQEHNVALAEKLYNNMETAFEEGDDDFLSTLGNCPWRLHHCFMHLSLCCCA